MNPRSLAVLAALALAPAATLAQEAVAPAAPANAAPAPAAETADVAAIGGKVASLDEQLAELKGDVAALKKLKFSGYLQGRWAWLENAVYSKGVAPEKDNFYVRRGRFKAVYDADFSQFVLQTDVTPAGVSIKEGYASVKLPYGLAVDAGLQLFPFGYEVAARSSSDLDLLERSMATQKLLKGEYDLGVAIRGVQGPVNFKVGLFNGNGVDAGTKGYDNDQRKDVIGRVGLDLGMLTAGVSGWWGKTIDYTTATHPEYDRVRVGADAQLFLDLLPIGGTAVKGEYLWGQTAIGTGKGGAGDSLGKTMSGYNVIVTQNVGLMNQIAVRWDSFIPDHGLDHAAAANAGKVFRTDEISAAVHTYVGEGLKLTVAYYHPMNGAKGATAPSDAKSDSVIAQAQVKF